MKPICIIPARGGSKGVPKKNIRKIDGKPLIAYTIKSALKSKIFSHVVVSTDDDEIYQISKKFGADVPFIRPKKLSADKTGASEVLLHGIKKLKKIGYDFDEIVLRDCTVPFIRNVDIISSLQKLRKQKQHIQMISMLPRKKNWQSLSERKNFIRHLIKKLKMT